MHPMVMPLYVILKLNTRLFINCLEGADDGTAVKRPNERSNNMTFVACHLLEARIYIAQSLGVEVESPLQELADVESVDEVKTFPALDIIRPAWQEISEILADRFAALTEDDLDRESPRAFPVDDRTILGCLAFLLEHESFHLGQLAFLRKHFGLGAMDYD